MKRSFPTHAVLSLTTGIMLPPPGEASNGFSDMHELAEFLVGEAIFTHQFAHGSFVKELQEGVLLQLPILRSVDPTGIGEDNWKQFRDAQYEAFGPTLELSPIGEVAAAQESFVKPLEGKKVIGIAI